MAAFEAAAGGTGGGQAGAPARTNAEHPNPAAVPPPGSPAQAPPRPVASLPETSPAANSSALPAGYFQAAVHGAGIPIVGMDPSGLIQSWNQAAARMFGRPESEVLGRPLDLLIPPEHRPIAFRALQRTLQQRSTNIYEIAFVPPGGKRPLHVGVTLSVILGSAGQCIGVMAWLRDITNRKALESNLHRTQPMASLGTLAAGVAHHFNNIACGMSTAVEVALATEDPGAMTRALRMSAEAASRIGYITQSLLSFSNPTGGEPDLCDLTEELLRFADAVEPTLNKKGITLELDLQARRIAAVPRLRFGQCLQHLLRNSEEAFAEIRDGRAKKITIRTASQDEQIMLQFTDNACGVSADELPQLFDPFFTTKGLQGGGDEGNPGLGLTLVHGVVMDMGGHIWADSIDGQGMTINLLIPVVV